VHTKNNSKVRSRKVQVKQDFKRHDVDNNSTWLPFREEEAAIMSVGEQRGQCFLPLKRLKRPSIFPEMLRGCICSERSDFILNATQFPLGVDALNQRVGLSP